jgi:hypothetical protein
MGIHQDDSMTREGWGAERSRTAHWHDPRIATGLGAVIAGIDYLTAMKDGRLPTPPFGELLQIDIDEVERGRVPFTCAPMNRCITPPA